MAKLKKPSSIPRRVKALTGISDKARTGRGNPRFTAQRKAAANVIRQARIFNKPSAKLPTKRKGLLPLNAKSKAQFAKAAAAKKVRPKIGIPKKVTLHGPGALKKAKGVALKRAKKGLGTKITRVQIPKFNPKKKP